MYRTEDHGLVNMRFFLKAAITALVVSLAFGIESFRPQFYYAATPYVYPLFYIFASVFMGLGWGILTALLSLGLIEILLEPGDSLGWGGVLLHCLQAGWLGLQARHSGATPVFSVGLRFWVWCGTPILCVLAVPYFTEFFWSGATIVLQELSGNLLNLVVFSLVFYGQSIRKCCARLGKSQSAANKHSLRYSAELGAGSLVILSSMTFFVTDRIIDHDAGNSAFSQGTDIVASLHNYRFQDSAFAIHHFLTDAFDEMTGPTGTLVNQLAHIMQEYPSICGLILKRQQEDQSVVVSQEGCASDHIAQLSQDLSNAPTKKHILQSSSVKADVPVWPVELVGNDYTLIAMLDGAAITQRSRGYLGPEASLENQLGMEAITREDYLNDLVIEPSTNPWAETLYHDVISNADPGRHFFSERLSEVFIFEFPAKRAGDIAVSGLRISFRAHDFATIQFRESGIFLSLVMGLLFALLILLRRKINHEVEAIEEFGALLEAYPTDTTKTQLELHSETAEVDGLKRHIIQLLESQNEIRAKQEETLRALADRAQQLTGMVEQSRAFFMIMGADGKVITENKMARSSDYELLRRSLMLSVSAHYRGEVCEMNNPITESATTWLQSGQEQHFSEVKLPVDYSEEPRTFTLEFAIIRGPETSYSARIEDISEIILTKEKLAHASRLAELGELATGVAHELNQPLNAILMASSNMSVKLDRQALSEEYLRDKLSRIDKQIRRASNIVWDLKSFAQNKTAVKAPVSLASLVTSAVDLVKVQFELDNVRITLIEEEKDLEVRANAQQVEQVLINLFNNARHVMKKAGGGEVVVRISRRERKGLITVRDTGPGVKPELRDKIFTPFFTTKMSEGGTGLGLSISYRLMKDNEGELRLLDSASGAVFEISVPLT